MLKKLAFAIALVSFAAFAATAQTKVDKYLGTWKLVIQPKTSYKSVTLNVSIDGEAFKVEKIAEYNRYGKLYSGTTIFSYKLSGATAAFLQSQQNGYSSTYLQYLSKERLRLVYTYKNADINREEYSDLSVREDWSLSSDGKTLTVDVLNFNRSSTKFVYTKQ